MEENKNVEVVAENAAAAETKEAKPEARRGNKPQRDGKRKPQRRNDGKEREIPHTVVAVKRVSKTVKGGRSMRFSALVVCGNGQGSVGFGTGKAKEVPDAIKKALGAAKKNMYRVPNPTDPWPFPHTTKAEKRMLLPPLTVFDTRLTATTV